MVTSIARPRLEAADTRTYTARDVGASSAQPAISPNDQKLRIVTYGEVWDAGHHLPEEPELTDEEREQWRSVPTSIPICRDQTSAGLAQ